MSSFSLLDTTLTPTNTLPLPAALPFWDPPARRRHPARRHGHGQLGRPALPRDGRDHLPVRDPPQDRKSTRLNSSHVEISYAVFCLKKKKYKPSFVCGIHERRFILLPFS